MNIHLLVKYVLSVLCVLSPLPLPLPRFTSKLKILSADF